MFVDFLLEEFERFGDAEAIIDRDRPTTYAHLRRRVEHWRSFLADRNIAAGEVVALERDFSADAVALFLATVDAGCILAPFAPASQTQRERLLDIAHIQAHMPHDETGQKVQRRDCPGDHPLYEELRGRGRPGLVLFSSGSTGDPKGAVHDFVPLLDKFRTPRKPLRAISFLLYDHIGGINTMLYVLSSGGCLVTVRERSAEAVLDAVQRHRVELLPTTPTFLNMLLVSEAYKRYDLSSLKVVSYGTEPMLESTLTAWARLLPDARLIQTYGLSEVGILKSKSRSNDSLWVKLGGEGFELRVVDRMLQIRSKTAMLGYLNAPSPFTADGWMVTGDRVEVDGEYYRILGRDSELINVGGQKVYPAEVESVIQELDEVAEVSVRGEKHPLTGQIVCATVTPAGEQDARRLRREIKIHCRRRMEPFKCPVKIDLTDEAQHGERFKKMRRPTSGGDE